MNQFIEMSRTKNHGGGSWSFGKCIWSPTRKKNGHRSAFWDKLLSVKKGDVVFHLQGKRPDAKFLGYSIAESDGYIASERPPDPGEWGYSKQFYKADLRGLVEFENPVFLEELFHIKNDRLREYFSFKKKSRKLENLFYVIQSDALQCQNGAYLSDASEELLSIIFETIEMSNSTGIPQRTTVKTGEAWKRVKSRIGQQRFSEEIKKLYDSKCCFPECDVMDPRFLIGAHISRWSDNFLAMGNLSNGLCLCLFHDKAFEYGYFVLNDEIQIEAGKNFREDGSVFAVTLKKQFGEKLRYKGPEDAINFVREHRERFLYGE